MGKKELQGIALAHLGGVKAFVYRRPLLPGNEGGKVGAVVRSHKGFQQGLGIGLGPDAFQQIPDDRFLVAGANQQGIPLPGGSGQAGRCLDRGGFLGEEQRVKHIKELITVTSEK